MLSTMLKLGKYLFVLPYAVFGFLHFGPLEFSLSYIPDYLPFPALWVYFTGVCLISFTVSAIWGKLDKLAAYLLALMMILFVLMVHIPKAIGGDFVQFIAIFRDTAVAGAAILYAELMARDNSFVSRNEPESKLKS